MELILAVFKKEWKCRSKDIKIFVISRLSSGILNILLFYLLSKLSNLAIGEDYGNQVLQFSVMGLVIYGLALSLIMSVGRSLMMEKRNRTFNQLVLSGSNLIKIELGYFLSYLPYAIGESIILTIVGYMIGVQYILGGILNFLISYIVFILCCFTTGILLSLVLVVLKETFIVQNTFLSILYFFCGVTFPISLFLPWISNLSSIFPLTLGIYLLRNSLQAGINTWSNIGTGILVSLAILIFANIFIAKFEDMMIN